MPFKEYIVKNTVLVFKNDKGEPLEAVSGEKVTLNLKKETEDKLINKLGVLEIYKELKVKK